MKEYRKRILVLLTTFLTLFSILILRVAYLSFFNQNLSEIKPEQKVQRGIIFDRRGTELAISQDSSTIGINPGSVYDVSFTASRLSQVLGMSQRKIENLIREKNNYFLLKREIENPLAKRVSDMALPGVRVEKEFKRIYPNGMLASNLIGFTGLDDDKALSGVELTYNKELMTSADKESPRGNDIHLTIDGFIQYKLESALGKAFLETRSKKAMGVFMDVHTGKILAMANFPNFDPNRYSEYSDEATTNWAIRHEYEPGSTMKIFMALILLNEGLIDLNEKFYCPGFVDFGNRRVKCGDAHGLVDLDEILQYSCNVGIIKAIRKVPDEKIYKYLKKFHFGQRTGFSNLEAKGYLPGIKEFTPSTSYFLAIGHGFSVTPIQLVTSAAAVVNGGRVHNPILVSHITDSYGEIIKQFQSESEIIGVHESTTKHLLRAMTKVVQHGTGKNAFRQGFLIAGKTGTAQISKKGQGYLEGLFSASFLGFFPATNPRIVGLILFDQPGGTIHSGGGIAAPVFREVVENIIPIIEYGETAHTYNLKEISLKDEKEKLDPSHVPDLKGKTMKEVIAILKNYNNIKYKTYGNGVCSKQEPKSGEALKNGDVWNIYFEE